MNSGHAFAFAAGTLAGMVIVLTVVMLTLARYISRDFPAFEKWLDGGRD